MSFTTLPAGEANALPQSIARLRFRDALRGVRRVSEKRMMGGLCLLVNGNMVGGVDRTKDGTDRFMFRVGKENESRALKRRGAYVVELGGRRFGGFIFVDAEACTARASRLDCDGTRLCEDPSKENSDGSFRGASGLGRSKRIGHE